MPNDTPDANSPYPVLDPAHPIAALSHLCALTVMAKAPRAGRVKTRLSPPLTLEQTAALNIEFLKDTTENLASIPHGAGLVSYTPVGDETLFTGLLPETFALVPQRGDGFGERLLAAAEDILSIGYGAVCLIDSDSPTVPAEAFTRAVEALRRPGDRIVLGPSQDGGYYLIGMKIAHSEPFQNIAWSTASVCRQTLEQCQHVGIEVVTLPTWYDVDDEETLSVLRQELVNGVKPSFVDLAGYDARHTRQLLSEMWRAEPVVRIL